MKALKYLICILLISIGCNSCEQLNHNSPDENIDWSEGDYAYIDLENNTEWETGIIIEDGRYLLVKKDTTNNGYIGYINSQAFDSAGIALYFNESLELMSFITNKGICYINRTEEDKADILIVTANENEIIENVSISSTKIIETKVAPVVPIIVGIAVGTATIKNIWDTVQATKELADGNWDGAKLDYLKIIAGTVTPTVFGGFIVDGAFVLLDKAKEDFDKKGQTCFLGNCQIQISQTKIGIKKFRIDVTVTGYETLPIISKITGEESIVFGGIAVAKTPYVTINSNDQIIQDWVINGNGTNSIEFEIPEDWVHYAIPYLLPTRGGKYEFRSNVRHGNTIKLPYFNGVIDDFKQHSYSKNGDKYLFKCYAHAICNTDDDEFWKLYYEDDRGEKVFFNTNTYEEPSISAPNSAEFEFEIGLDSELFKNGKKHIKLGIATFTKSHFIMLASEPQLFELTTEGYDRWVDLGLPSGILWAKYNVGATSPEEYGGYYAWGETEEKSSYTWENYKYLNSASESYINIGSNICGTTYDVAHMEWGEGARMPTHNEIKELLQYCSKNRTTEGFDFIGPNGNKINLPLAGGKEYTLFGTNEYAYYRSGSQYNDPDYYDEDDVYCLIFEDEWYIDPDQSRQYGFSIRPVKDKETGVENQ